MNIRQPIPRVVVSLSLFKIRQLSVTLHITDLYSWDRRQLPVSPECQVVRVPPEYVLTFPPCSIEW